MFLKWNSSKMSWFTQLLVPLPWLDYECQSLSFWLQHVGCNIFLKIGNKILKNFVECRNQATQTLLILRQHLYILFFSILSLCGALLQLSAVIWLILLLWHPQCFAGSVSRGKIEKSGAFIDTISTDWSFMIVVILYQRLMPALSFNN